MITLNKNLLTALPSVLGVRQVDFAEKVFGNGRMHMYRQLRNGQWDGLTCVQLVDICNAYHIPLNVLMQEKPITYTTASQIQAQGEWKPVVFTPERIYQTYTDKSSRLQQRDFAKAIGCTSSCLYRWLCTDSKCMLTVGDALKMLWTLELNTDFLFQDPNAALPNHINTESRSGAEKALAELQELRETLRAQQNELDSLRQENKTLRRNQCLGATAEPEVVYLHPWRFNTELWENLHTVIGISRRELQRNTASRLNMEAPSVQLLVSVCNRYGISTRHFLARSSNEKKIQPKDHYVSDDFKPVVFAPERLNDIFCVGNMIGRKRKDVLDIIGISDMTARRWVMSSSRISVTELVDLCNRLDVTPDICIHDQNGVRHGTTLTELLIAENVILRQQLMHLKK